MSHESMLAYVGPGPGLTMFWAFLALIGTIGLAILSLLLWPIRMLIRHLRGQTKPVDSATANSAPSNEAPKADDQAALR